ncbi:hypothetical protein [Citrobacter braakii]|uniref:hypothetical protein n=1 Tax=Citrobacter braakii TaxID=57706 RepID=UPI002B2523A0|nr:hypothetical protein [Citrobacter braakii]MEB2305469.1 hypothetical protein [Citrobacter braakii]
MNSNTRELRASVLAETGGQTNWQLAVKVNRINLLAKKTSRDGGPLPAKEQYFMLFFVSFRE